MASKTSVTRTPAYLFPLLFVAQYLLYAVVRIGVLDPGLYVGFSQPSAASARAWVSFVQMWNHAMMFAFPVMVLGLGAFAFGSAAFFAITRCVRGRSFEFSLKSSFNVGVRGFLVPSVVAYVLYRLFMAHPSVLLLPLLANWIVFHRFSRKAMLQAIFASVKVTPNKAS